MHFHFDGGGETLGAVVLGALLASFGGFAAGQIEARIRRRERERAAALLFGEVLNALDTVLTIAVRSTGLGDPFGLFTRRLMRAAHREVAAYERHRTALYDVGTPELRMRVHSVVVRLQMSLDSIFELTGLIDSTPTDARESLETARLSALDFLIENQKELSDLVAQLEAIAKVDFAGLRTVAGNIAGAAGANAGSADPA